MAIGAMTLHRAAATALTVVLSAGALLVSGCSDKNKPASQTAAKVNKEEITVHQINFLLSQQRGAANQAAGAGRQALERLIDQELMVQKAAAEKIDRDPRIVQQIEASRREIVARAAAERAGAAATKPTPAEIKAYYDSHPALFKERKLYNLVEVMIEAKPEQIEALRAKAGASKSVADFAAYLKADGYKFASGQAVRAPEQLPLRSVDRFASMKDGESIFGTTPQGAQVVFVGETRSQPVDEQQAAPAIEQFLLNERKRKIVDDELQSLRRAAKIEYVGEYARAASGVAGTPPSDTAVLIPASAASGGNLGEGVSLPELPVSGPSQQSIDKALKGMK